MICIYRDISALKMTLPVHQYLPTSIAGFGTCGFVTLKNSRRFTERWLAFLRRFLDRGVDFRPPLGRAAPAGPQVDLGCQHG